MPDERVFRSIIDTKQLNGEALFEVTHQGLYSGRIDGLIILDYVLKVKAYIPEVYGYTIILEKRTVDKIYISHLFISNAEVDFEIRKIRNTQLNKLC